MKLEILSIIILIFLSMSVLAESGPLYVKDAICGKDGSTKIIFGSQSTNKMYKDDLNIIAKYVGDLVVKQRLFNVTGEWDYDFIKDSEETTLVSEDVLFGLRGEYLLTVNYKYIDNNYILEYRTYCPGFEFSCKLLNVYIDYCKNYDDRFEVAARIYGMGDVTKEGLSLEENIEFKLQADYDYEDIEGKISKRGSLPKGVNIITPKYGVYFFNVSNFDNKINSMAIKVRNINYIEGGCINFPNISLYDYTECKEAFDKKEIVVEEKITSNVVKVVETDEGVKEGSNWSHILILIVVFGLCAMGIIYILFKRNFNKEPSL